MPKRPCPDDTSAQPIKLQVSVKNSELQTRKIWSSASENVLQILYDGSKKLRKRDAEIIKSVCKCDNVDNIICNYCDVNLCQNCTRICYYCQNGFCQNCSFNTYDEKQAVCYTCYK